MFKLYIRIHLVNCKDVKWIIVVLFLHCLLLEIRSQCTLLLSFVFAKIDNWCNQLVLFTTVAFVFGFLLHTIP